MGKLLFLYKFLSSPRSIGSVTPSSRFLARAMIKPIDFANAKAIAELGAGTGIFTEYLRENKRNDCKLVVFEKDDNMRNRLQNMYPDLSYYNNASDIYNVMRKLKIQNFDYILSGLPFANFPQELRDAIMDGVEKALKPGGLFIAFQYSQQMKRQLHKRFEQVDIDFVPLNIPPAFVYCCRKRDNLSTRQEQQV
ncbi:methyltransferase domain-containing protein [Aneurinibacillus thermoaerophilus]|uniref:class I SAM-dependent methyltransferase n=1 Tax=Aneurinibacillus thermoaerophilus TaxID=143495 RepID=UPI002E246480|nr:methyltransferase domain-containing protein [Aneurinibacillus thermoaerophilus]MED0764209.1 methyltransferase domain-containing protein [Aneurinibacillus thermoaerophilus]